jgi:hypothetical protein
MLSFEGMAISQFKVFVVSSFTNLRAYDLPINMTAAIASNSDTFRI